MPPLMVTVAPAAVCSLGGFQITSGAHTLGRGKKLALAKAEETQPRVQFLPNLEKTQAALRCLS